MRFLKTTMRKKLTPAVTVLKADRQQFPLKALYIEALNEYFTEIPFAEDKEALLSSLEHILKSNPKMICFLSFPASDRTECLRQVRQCLGENSALERQLQKQFLGKLSFSKFLDICKKLNITTVHVGGVYGKACVWDFLRSHAQNIYAKQLGDNHPNIRYSRVGEKYRFKNGVILDDITEGYTDRDITLSELACFPETRRFLVDIKTGKDIVSLGETLYPGEVGESYKRFSSVDDRSLPNYYALHKCVQEFLTASKLMSLRHAFFADNDFVRASAPSTCSTAPCL